MVRIIEGMNPDIENKKLNFLLEHSPTGVICINELGKIDYVNNTLSNWLCYSKEELLTLELLDINNKGLENILSDKNINTDSFYAIFKRKDKSIFSAETSVVQYNELNNPAYIFYIKDISNQKNQQTDSFKNQKLINESNSNTDEGFISEASIEKELTLELFKLSIDHARNAIFWVNENTHFEYVNEQACKSLGYTRDELLMLNLFDIDPDITEEINNQLWEYYRLNRDKNVVYTKIESRHKRKDGSIFPVEIFVTHFWKYDKEYDIAQVVDISERKKYEQALVESEERSRLFVENTPLPVAMFDTQMNYIIASKQWYKKYNIEDVSIIDKNHYTIFPETTMEWKNLHQRVINGEVIKCKRDKFIRQDGSIQWVRYELHPWFKEDSTIGGMVAFTEDITENVVTEEALKQSEIKMQRIFDVAPVGLGIVKDRILMKVNSQMCEISGYSEEELIGSNIQFLYVDKNEYDRAGILLYQKINKKGIGNVETVWKSKQAKLIDVLISIVLIDPDDPSKGSIFTCLDITKRKVFQQQLLEAKKNAEQSDRLKSAFLANMSHEIRTPMNAIIGFSSFLKDDDLAGEDRNKFVDIIMTSGELLLALINDIIDISKIDSGNIDIVKVNVKINSLILEIFNFFQSYLLAKNKTNVELRLDIPEEEIIVYTDEMRLKQILMNIIGNAVKFTNKGFINIVCKKEGDFLNFTIQDTGIGICDEKKEIIFERFQQGGNSTEKNYGGTGLGLAIAKACVELLGGKISLKSEVGEGTTFYFSIKIKQSNLL